MLKRRWNRQPGIQQMFIVFTAFFTMILVTYLLVGRIMQTQLAREADKNLSTTEVIIRECMLETEVTLVNTGITLIHMIENGMDRAEIIAYMQDITEYLGSRTEQVTGYEGIYGYICGEYMDGFTWNPEPDYMPQDRPWYKSAIGKQGEVVFSSPYTDAMTGYTVVSVSRELIGTNGDSYGVLGVDVVISRITRHVSQLNLTEDGYGLLLDKDFKILANENPDRFSTLILLVVLGIVLMTVLCAILYKLNKARIRSEDESRSKSSFLAHVSHEIRTPMNSIIGMSELALRDETISDSVFDNVYAIYQSGANLLALINDILDVSKIESGKMEIISAPYRINAVLNEAFNVIKVRLDKQKVRFAVYVSSEIPSMMVGDEIRIRQILLNLLTNAAKYTREGCIVLSIFGEYQAEDRYLLKIQIEDTGIGIKEEDLKELFQEFSRVDILKNHKVEGSGLGLVITKRLCQAMGGTIAVESQYGSGSVFTVEIPQKVTDCKPLAAITPSLVRPVLVLEDNVRVARVIQWTFADLSISVKVVTDDEAFEKQLRSGRYGWVFVPYERLEYAKKCMQNCESAAKLVEMVPRNWSPHHAVMSVILPLYSLPVANVLNGLVTTESVNTVEDECHMVAPEARILVVDDIQVNLKVAEGLLAQFDIKADTCLSGREAIEMVQKKSYDIVFMDHMMPEMDGIETVRQIRALPGDEFNKLTIIALTANELSGIRELLLGSRMNDYLAKPIEIRNLNYILEKWLPKEIQQEEGAIISSQNTDGQISSSSLSVNGINISDGIKRFGGDKKAYWQALKSYVLHTPGLLHEIQGFMDCPERYAVAVHGLKGSSYYICAYEVGAYAEHMEQESKAGNHEAIRQETTALLTLTSSLIENIRQAIESDSAGNKRNIAHIPDKTVLEKMRKCCRSFDIQGMIVALETLEQYQYEKDDELITELRKKIEELEYDELLGQLEEYLL